MNCREKTPVAPRRTEEVARETLAGLCLEATSLRRSDDPMAWDRLEAIGQEIAHVAATTAREFRRRRMSLALDVLIVADFHVEVH